MTTVAIHQPHYLPWLPYVQKIASADHFVYLDNVQYQKGGLQNRNRIKTPNGSAWLTVPVHASMTELIDSVTIAGDRWKKSHDQSIMQSYARSSNLDFYHTTLKPVLFSEYTHLADLNIAIIQCVLDYLEIETRITRASSLQCAGDKEERVLDICRQLDASIYLSGEGARVYQSESRFEENGIKLVYHQQTTREYRQCHMKGGFTQGMSILDLLLNMGKDARSFL